MFAGVDATMFLAILPEIAILVLGGLVLIFDLFLREKGRRLGWLAALGLLLIILLTLLFGRPGDEPTLVWGGMLRHDWLGFVFKLLFLLGAVITTLFAMDIEELGQRGEFYLLLLASTLGMSLMAAAADLIMLYLAIETTSIPLYVLAGFFKREDRSTEAGFKYLLFGAMTSTVMLYGFSLLYGFAGTTSLYELPLRLAANQVPLIAGLGVLTLVLVGFGFKVSVVPFHFWAPDVYEGAPIPVAGFLSTASKAAGFVVLLRVLLIVFPSGETIPVWMPIIAALSTVTMTLGNVMALVQRNIKRLLAYSSIAHAGYVLIGVSAVSVEMGVTSAVFYLITYLLTNLAAFGVVATFWRVTGSDEIMAFSGLSRRSKWLALVVLVSFLSLAGVPPFAGFVAKVWVFAAAVDAGLIWLAIIGVINAIIGIYYYLLVLKVIYLYRSEDEEKALPITRPYTIALTALCVGIILMGTAFGPWFEWSMIAAKSLF
ncbi:MAG: NADH-quinone oxidoreductase subunit N [Chloroflexota bacterium]